MIALLLALQCVPLPTCSPAVTTNCATPTPVIQWAAVPDTDVKGYGLYYRDTGATAWIHLADLDGVPYDSNGDDQNDALVCTGAVMGIPVQRVCSPCQAYSSYDFSVDAYDTSANRSVALSDPITVCFSPVWPGPPAAYN